jgi:hypothetical protein
MPRFFKLRDGHDWLWTDVLDSEDMIESFAQSIQRDAPGLTVEQIVPQIKVYRFHESHPLGGKVSRLECELLGGPKWVATRETE